MAPRPRPIPRAVNPDRMEALQNYRDLASAYDGTCTFVTGVRRDAIQALNLRHGDVVLDIACGTGACLPDLARLVGPDGSVIGIEQSPEMAEIAAVKLAELAEKENILVVVSPLEDIGAHLTPDVRGDAALLCFTQDVLQNPGALEQLFMRLKPGARIAVTGVRLQPWWYGWPVNLWALMRSRRYFTTTRGLRQPWRPLLPYCPDLAVRRTYHAGMTYMASGTVRSSLAGSAAGSTS